MKHHSTNFPLIYKNGLRAHLKQGQRAKLEPAIKLGQKALVAGLQTLDLAKLHESTLVIDLLPAYPERKREAVIKRASTFFATVISANETNKPELGDASLKKAIETLSDRTIQLATANQQLSIEAIQRKKAEKALKKSEANHLKALEKSNSLREQLRKLSRRVLSAQEDERKKISRDLHDVVAQELMGISVQLATLKKSVAVKAKGLNRDIALAQKRVMKSANIIHQFSRQLRPTALDDLGLIPALHSFMQQFTEQTSIRTHLTAFAEVDTLSSTRRTAFYRIAQEAFCNIARHANASRADITILKEVRSVRMEIHDNGRSFNVGDVLPARGNKHLGLLGMRERIEMIGGTFSIESSPGKGTTVIAQIPITTAMAKAWKI